MIMVGVKRHGKTLKQMEFVSSILIGGTCAYSCVGFLNEESRDFFLEFVTKKLKEENIEYKQYEGEILRAN